jgi:serine/threonine-protein kinase
MNADRYQQVKQVFLAACDLEPCRWPAFLDQACAADPELRREVESLLEHHRDLTVIRGATRGGEERNTPLAIPAGSALEDLANHPPGDRFAPGEILAGRYRILGRLGRGGMGDVYRADDLKLGQPVALKFLARYRSQIPDWVRRYQNEVRLARRVTHVNVLRVYDIGEAEGDVFISMEYVDGEDLAALLRRVGRLTGEKALDVARQLCAGLGAAHDRGVLHRDLKPANIMIDARGQVRIADFGIALAAPQADSTGELIGTPAYMAPELFAGGTPSVGTDLFSLGVVLYEALAGKPPWARNLPHAPDPTEPLIRPSAIVSGVDPRLESVICQCLERDAQRRPASAYAVAMALPGANALAEAVAAGQTPSPSMLVEADPGSVLRAPIAIGSAALATVALLLVTGLADRTFFLPQAGLTKPPAVLAERAENVIATLGGASSDPQRWSGFAIDGDFLQRAIRDDELHDAGDEIGGMRPPAAYFWYRTGSKPMVVPTLLNEPLPSQSLPSEGRAISIRLDGQGKLVQYLAPAQKLLHNVSPLTPGPSTTRGEGSHETALAGAGASRSASASVNWAPVFELAGLRLSDFRPVYPARAPPVYADVALAWEETPRPKQQAPLRVEAAAVDGRVVFFNIIPPWDEPSGDALADEAPTQLGGSGACVRWLLYVLGMLGGGLLAWRNIVQGRGDLRGASNLAAMIMLLGLLDWLFGEGHPAILREEVASLYQWIARATVTAGVAWVCYVAVEPYARRYWPDIMISWTRVLHGRIRDPLVNRDLLIGGMCGIVLVLLTQLDVLLPSWLGGPPATPKLPGLIHDLTAVLGLRYKLSIVVLAVLRSITLGLFLLLLVLVLRVLLRPARLAWAASWLLLTFLGVITTGCDVAFPWLISSISALVAILLLTRLGLLAMIVSLFVSSLLANSPITCNIQAWYAPSGTSAVVLIFALLGYALFTVRTDRPLFRSLP